MYGMRKEWFLLAMHCSLESVAERISSKVCRLYEFMLTVMLAF